MQTESAKVSKGQSRTFCCSSLNSFKKGGRKGEPYHTMEYHLMEPLSEGDEWSGRPARSLRPGFCCNYSISPLSSHLAHSCYDSDSMQGDEDEEEMKEGRTW